MPVQRLQFYSPIAGSPEPGSGNPSTSTPSSSLNIDNYEEEDLEKYWRTKFAHWALESVLLRHDEPNCGQHPELTEDMMKSLMLHFYNAVDEHDVGHLIPPNVTATIQRLVDEEVRRCLKSVVQTALLMLQDSEDQEEKAWYEKMTTSDNPLLVVIHLLEAKKLNTLELERRLESLQKDKSLEMSKLETDFQEIKDDLHRLADAIAEKKNPEDLIAKIKILELEERRLDLEQRKLEEEIEELSNPIELQVSMQTALKELKSMNDQLRTENKIFEDFFTEYDAQPPEVKAKLAELQALNEAIERQQWMLRKIQKFDQNESDVIAMDDSFVSQHESSF